MPSREKRLRIPAALVFALLAPGCSGTSNGCNAYCSPAIFPDGGVANVGDAGASECTGPHDPRLTDPNWQCFTPI